jgi:hypothetical protein
VERSKIKGDMGNKYGSVLLSADQKLDLKKVLQSV